MTDLTTLVPTLKRAVAVPGTFDTYFPDATTADLKGQLMDGFAEVQLYGGLTDFSMDDNGVVTPDLDRGEGAIVVIFAMVRMLANELRNRPTHTRFEAKGNVAETDRAASVMTQLLKDYQAQKKSLLEQLRYSGTSAFIMADNYLIRGSYPDYPPDRGF